VAGVFGRDADVAFVDEQQHAGAGMSSAEADVVQAAVVPDRDDTAAVDAGAAGAVVLVNEDASPAWAGVRAGGKRLGRGAAVERPVRSGGVAVGGEGVELGLQCGDGAGAGLTGQPLLHRLVENVRPCRRWSGDRAWNGLV
jgi:hypothetical protein